jgi:molybdopterin synthase catalytic subunit
MGEFVKIVIRCFASVRELLGSDVFEFEVPEGMTVNGLKELLAERAPDLARLKLACAVNREYADPTRVLADGDEVAFIPPISGGEDTAFRFDLTREPIDPRALEAEVRTDEDGAVVTFAGVTRNHNDGSVVESLSYEAYEEMVFEVMASLLAEASAKFEVTRMRVVHRLGEIPIGETCVAVVVGSPHRAPAFDACRFLMDRLKQEAPIFKKERLARSDDSRWVGELPTDRPQV